ncbi:MAG: hypothetical protein V7604_4997 [Hyphomicrobiales bacterium]|jgi:hypothetical protein
MRTKAKITLALMLTLTSASSLLADNYPQGRSRSPRNQAPVSLTTPRMIESKPGLWTSSYDCVTDEGYGRYRSCSAY